MELKHIYDIIKETFDGENAAREKGLSLSRDAIQFCANSIRATHRGDREEAVKLLDNAKTNVESAHALLAPFPRIYYAGFLQEAEKEFSEASATLALVEGKPLPLPDELDVGVAPYLNGLGEAVGEMRRHVLDLIRNNHLDRGEDILMTMDDIYYLLASVDYPNAITAGLKRTNDMVRGVLERTRGDLTTAIRRQSLEQTIKELEKKLIENA
ncbi:MAG: haloacid dehalogenase [Candidatus Anoxymicrobium japonicum]|uniref:Haloacid dehalogenase n=1 Tax=Candidatus Anoxymicrobium japonicum TaxID=2013648 RepID=A0A2N3G600_9ACTN|nr:MAG: haloacid dehalogenase [Candidatus Anoxymicrobium japonicum]